MRPFVYVLFFLAFAQPGRAQDRIRNVRIRVLDSARIEIRYDLPIARPGDSVYFQIRSRLRGPLLVLPDFVQGDVGKRILAGSDRRIVWNALANGYSLNEEIRAVVTVRAGLSLVQTPPTVAVTSPPNPPQRTQPTDSPTQRPAETPTRRPIDPPTRQPTDTRPIPPAPPPPSTVVTPVPEVTPSVPDTARSRRRRYAGPAWALLSAVAPGVGNIFVQTPRPRVGVRPLLALGCYGLIAYGLRERQSARDGYALYEQQRNRTTAEPYYQQANDHHHRYYVATRGAVVVAAADVILTFFRGVRNQRATRVAPKSETVTIRPSLQAGQPTMVMRYTF